MARKKWNPAESSEESLKFSEAEIYAMRAEFFDKVTDPEMRSRILTIAFAYGDDVGTPHATDMMAWYLAQPENLHKIDDLALEYLGYVPGEGTEGSIDAHRFPVPNGVSWTFMPPELAMRPDDSKSLSLDYVWGAGSDGTPSSLPPRVQVFIPARDQAGARIDVAGERHHDFSNWTSVVVRSVHGHELNLVFYDAGDFSKLLDEARGGFAGGGDEFFLDEVDTELASGTEDAPRFSRAFRDAIIAAGRPERIKTREDAVLALSAVAALWKGCWSAGEIHSFAQVGDFGDEVLLNVLYEDDETTMRLLEGGMYLPQGDRLTPLDAVLAKALTDLLDITTAFPGDITSRNHGAISAHVAALPDAKNLYPKWMFGG